MYLWNLRLVIRQVYKFTTLIRLPSDEGPPRLQVADSNGSSEALYAPTMNLGPMTRARARKLRESFQAFLQVIHSRIGRIQETHHTLMNLIQANEETTGP